LIYALGIRHVGEKAAVTLARHFRTMESLLESPVDVLQDVSEIGPVLAESVRLFADEPRNRALIERLKAAGVRMDTDLPRLPSARRCRWPARPSSSPARCRR
jgi:DNA ligase (NAD+)